MSKSSTKFAIALASILAGALPFHPAHAQTGSPVGDWKCTNPPGTVPNQDEWIFYSDGRVTKIFTPAFGNGNVTSQGTWSLRGSTVMVRFASALSCTGGFGCMAMDPGQPLAIPFQRTSYGVKLSIFECAPASSSFAASPPTSPGVPPFSGRSSRSAYVIRNEIYNEENIIARCERLMRESTDPSVSAGCGSTIGRARQQIMVLEQELQSAQ